MNNRDITNWFKKYKKIKKDEFFLKGEVRADSFLVTEKTKNKINNKNLGITIFSEDYINEISPNNIDSCHFWKKATETFPLSSIVYHPGCKDEIELNEISLKNIHEQIGTLNELEKILINNPSSKILEIGPGYGAITGYISVNHELKNYYAIDVNPMFKFKFKRLYKTDGKTIPNKVPNGLDVVYSVNVFQHLSPEQRMSYYKQIKDKLKVGGKFIFSMFVVDLENEYITFKRPNGELGFLFGMRDEKGNCYTNFFSQLTKCDRIEELEEIFSQLNMKLEVVHKHLNLYSMVVTKL